MSNEISGPYLQFRAQREEILKHKWFESEKAGHDIGFERALTDWVLKHRTVWLQQWQQQNQRPSQPD